MAKLLLAKGNTDSSPKNREGCLASPILSMDGYDEIYRFLCSKIEEQSTAMVTVTEKLQQLCKSRGGAHDGPQNLCKLVFAGPSGCGKTETVKWLLYLLGMDTGYEHEGQFIRVEPDSESGALAHSLNEALNIYAKDENRGGAPLTNNRRRYPRFMMMIIDDVSTRFIASITSLLNSGRYTTPTQSFRLPSETMLLVVFTCNYGEAQIREMKYRVEHEATYFIQSDMYQNELSKNQVALMGKVIPFYPLKPATLRSILMKRLEEFIASSDICQQFGEVKYDGDVKNMLIDKVIDLTAPGCGIRSGLGELFEKIDGFFEKALRELNRKERELKLRDKKKRDDEVVSSETANNLLVLSLREIDSKEMEAKLEKECDEFIREIIQGLLKDPQSLEMIQYHREKHENINALSMHFDMHHLVTSDLCGSVVYAHQQNNLFNHCQFGVSHAKYTRLKEQNKGLKRAIERVGTLLYQHGSKGKRSPPVFKEIKEILTESTKDMVLDDEDTQSEYDEPEYGAYHGRVEEIEMADQSGGVRQIVRQSSISTSTSEEEEEEEEERESKTDKIIRLYGGLNPDELSDISLPSEIDESSGEEREREAANTKQRNKALKEKLLRRVRHEVQVCQGPCGQLKSVLSFNPQLRNYSRGPEITFRDDCNRCRCRKRK